MVSEYDTHHLYVPRRAYKTKLERTFRNLPCNTVKIDRAVHNYLHTLPPPQKPSIAVMEHFVRRHKTFQCACYERDRKIDPRIHSRAIHEWREADQHVCGD